MFYVFNYSLHYTKSRFNKDVTALKKSQNSLEFCYYYS